MVRVDPDWPNPERSVSEASDKLRAVLMAYIETQIGDRPDLVDKIVPNYPPYGKRMLVDNGWYQALRRDDVRLVTSPITSITSDGVTTIAGHDELDVLVYATGFKADRVLWPIQVTGAGGVDITARLEESPEAYLGIAPQDGPNLFITPGPNGTPGHGGNGMLRRRVPRALHRRMPPVDVRPERSQHDDSRRRAAGLRGRAVRRASEFRAEPAGTRQLVQGRPRPGDDDCTQVDPAVLGGLPQPGPRRLHIRLTSWSQPGKAKLRNIDANPNVALALDVTDIGRDVIRIEGTAVRATDRPSADRVPEYVAKYVERIGAIFGTPERLAEAFSQAIVVTPRKLHA